jgi:hypothetical protein
MVTIRSFAIPFALAVLFVCATAAAQSDGDSDSDSESESETAAPHAEAAVVPAPPVSRRRPPALHHPPVAIAPSGNALLLDAEFEHPELVKRAFAVYHGAHDATLRQVEFQRSMEGYVAELPADAIRPPWIAYALEVELVDGTRQAVFASRKSPHLVEVPEDLIDTRERAHHDRLEGRRSVASASAEYVSFGETEALVTDPTTGRVASSNVKDNYYRIEGAYTYRLWRWVNEFSMRIGRVRGNSPVPLEADERSDEQSDRFAVGLDYGAATVRLRADDLVHLEGELLVGLTEVRVAGGGGGAIVIGDPYGTRLTLGFEVIEVFGSRFYSRFDVRAVSRLTLAPVIEVTNMPHANRYGVRLLGEVGVDIGAGFRVAARGGYQARLAAEGGPTFGGTLAYAF